jgi:hypothetical protein
VGNPAMTFVRGHLAWDGANLHTQQGFGKYVNRPTHSPYFENQMLRNTQKKQEPVKRTLPTRAG